MKALIVATSYKPKNFLEELGAGQRYRLEYLELSDQLPASYMDYDTPWMHDHRLVRKLEERIHADFFWAWEIAQKVKQEKFDVVLSMSERIAVPLGVILDPQVKHIAILLNAMTPKWLSAIKLLNLQQRWSHIITYSQAEADALMAKLSIGPEKISSCLNYVDLEFFHPSDTAPNPDETPFFMSQGLSRRDYPTLIRAMQKLPHVTCQLSAVSAWDRFKAGYEGMDIPSNVQLKSFNHPSLIKDVTAESRFVVIPLRSDTGMWCAGSTSVLQAQALGKPVIVTYLPGIAEYVKDGETGYLVKGNDPDAMASAIDRLWQDPVRTAEMGKAAQKWVRENFSLPNYVGRISTLLRQTCETRKVQDDLLSMDIKTKPRRMDLEGKEKVHL
ncbi:MAG TPA: glycosyltransferase family 4 protein [Anaerolineales bacterium]|nr:glycosyltransferase family 4 protein [Anaerolineales bacterium]